MKTLLASALLVLVLPASCLAAEGEMRYGMHVTLPAKWLDPGDMEGFSTPYMIVYAIHDAMVKPMPAGMQTPSLAESWSEAKDHLSYTFTLRKNAKFHDGSPVTPEDVKFSFERYKGTSATLLKEKMKEVQVVGPSQVRFVLKEPWPDFMLFYGTTASGAGWIVPKKYVEKVGEDGYKKTPVGAGPYKVVSFTPGVEIVLDRAAHLSVRGRRGAARLRPRARQEAARRGRLSERLRRGRLQSLPALQLDGRGHRRLFAGRRHQDPDAHDGARGILHGVAREEAARDHHEHHLRHGQRRHAAGAVRDQARHLRLRLAARDRRPLRATGARARSQEARGPRASHAVGHDRARAERADLRPGLHLGRRAARGVQRRQRHPGLSLLRAVRGFEDKEVSYALGIDIGGTFTDIVVYDHAGGRQYRRKVRTTHDDPARAVAAGVEGLLRRHGLPAQEFTRVVHATTLFTNALIERRGAVTGLITTEGFRDTLEIGRERKFELYDLNTAKPEPLVPRNLRLEVRERLRADGAVERRLDTREVAARAGALVRSGVDSIAIVFLHAYANPRHEAAAARVIARRHPGIAVTTSHEVAPEIREYERASTTVANAYIKPLARRYLDAMARRLADLGIPAPLLLMLSSGGLTHVAEAERTPVQMLESGPAAGALAAAFFGREDSHGNLLAFDMGGTTAKLSLVDGGEPLTAYAFEAARQKRFMEGSGLPIRISTIELIEIGAGGGSIPPVA